MIIITIILKYWQKNKTQNKRRVNFSGRIILFLSDFGQKEVDFVKKKKKDWERIPKEPYRFPTIYPGEPLTAMRSEQTDPFGSYTGNAVNNEVPVQDADDL